MGELKKSRVNWLKRSESDGLNLSKYSPRLASGLLEVLRHDISESCTTLLSPSSFDVETSVREKLSSLEWLISLLLLD